jgi:hypothetical protein
MKKQLSAAIISILFCIYVSPIYAKNDISNIFKTGNSDLKTVANGYLMPAGKSFSGGLGTDWFNSAEVHSPFGFEVTLDAGVVLIPASDQTFKLAGLTNLQPTNPNITRVPSFGGTGSGVELNLMQPKYLIDGILVNPLWNNGAGIITTFTTPDGVSKYTPTAGVRLTLGLPYVNDVSVRFMPKVAVSGFESYMWGIGVKHNFKQWIPNESVLPFDAACMLTYSRLYVKYAFPFDAQITPDRILGQGLEYTPDFQLNVYSTQAMKIDAGAMTANIIVSKKLTFASPYLGFGVSKNISDLTMVGIYPTIRGVVPVISGTSVVAKMQIENVTNPIHISTSEVMPNLTVGMRLNVLNVLFPLTFHLQYTLQKYPVASAGFGVLVR